MSHTNDPNIDDQQNLAITFGGQPIDNSIIGEPVRFQTSTNCLTIPMQYCAILIISYCLITDLFGIGQYWYGLLFVLVGIVTRVTLQSLNNESGVTFGESQPFHHDFDTTGNAQAIGDIAHPMDEDITFSLTVINVIDIPLGIENTHAHDLVDLVHLNIAQRPQVIINYENGHINEDATLYDTQDDQNILPVIHMVQNVPIPTNVNNVSQPVIDNPTCNINPVQSAESQDNTNLSDSSWDDEQIISSQSDCDADDEDDSGDDVEQRGQASPNSAQNVADLNEAAHVQEQPIITELATEIERSTNTPTERALPVIYPTNRLIPKPTSPVISNQESNVA